MHSGKTLTEALAETPAAALIARCERADQAAHLIAFALEDSVPAPAAPTTFRCQIRERTLLVNTASAAQAAKLRQSLPRLLAMLQERGLNLNEIRVRVQPSPSAEADSGGGVDTAQMAAAPAHPGLIAAGALQFADQLARTLKPSPLRDAAERLARRLRSVPATKR